MNNPQFTIPYNGDNVEVTALADNSFLIQVTYKPLLISEKLDDQGNSKWIEVSTNVNTHLSQELGTLIKKHYVKVGERQPA